MTITHELVIYCFETWWQATVYVEKYDFVIHDVDFVINPSVVFQAITIFDKTTNKFICNKNNTSAEQVKLEMWMTPSLPILDISVNEFERKRKSYYRGIK